MFRGESMGREEETLVIKKRIEVRFRKKVKGRVLVNVPDGSRLRIEYMYGGKYCLLKRTPNSKNTITLTMLADSQTIAELIIKEKYGISQKSDLGTKLKGLTANLKSRNKR